jgi:diguanylate cyclase (GGDEF)-like protein
VLQLFLTKIGVKLRKSCWFPFLHILLISDTPVNAVYEKIHQLNEQAWSDRNKDVRKSLTLAQQVQAMIEENPGIGTLDLVLCLRTQAYCLDQLSRYSDALTAALKAMELANPLGDLRLIASIDNVLGSVYWRLADYSSSLDHYIHGLHLVEIEPDPGQEVYLLQGLGALHYEIGDYEEALNLSKRSIDLNPADITAKVIGLNNTAYILHQMKRHEEALPYALQAWELYGDEQFSVGKLELLHTLGSIYLQMGDIERSSSYFEDVAQAAEYQENPLQKINALFGICQIHEIRGEREQALQKLLQVLQISQDIGSLSSECSVHELLAKHNKLMGDYQKALDHFETFHAIHVQIFNEQAERRLHNARLLLEVETIQKEANLYRTLAATDMLTGLLSRREIFELGARLVDQARSKKTPVSLLMIDLDNFKTINDQAGHSVGDHVLSIVARRIKNTLRQDDLAGRYGGDEFLILTPDLEMQDCQRIAERCQSVVSGTPIEIAFSRFWINLSIGLVVSNANCTLDLEGLIQRVDQSLLRAKKSGRNQIVSSEVP